MDLKKYAFRYIWFILLLGVAAYFLFFRFSNGTINPASKKFAISDTSSITSITFQNDSISLSLKRTEKGWLLNNTYSIRPGAVQAFLNVITRIQARSPIPKSVTDSLTRLIDSQGLSVQIFGNDKLIREFRILSTKTLGLGTIGKLKDAKIGFSLQLLGYENDISSLFVLDPDYWKSNKLFIADIKQIAKIDVELPDNPEKSFSISLSDNSILLKATYFDKKIDGFDTSRVINFILGLTNLSYDKLLSKSTLEDRAAIVLSQPNQIFTITLLNSNKLVLKTYPIPIDEYRDEFGRTIKFDLNKLYISFNNDAIIAIASYMVFDPVLKDLSSFRIKN